MVANGKGMKAVGSDEILWMDQRSGKWITVRTLVTKILGRARKTPIFFGCHNGCRSSEMKNVLIFLLKN